MKNKEKYLDEILEEFIDGYYCRFIRKHILKVSSCTDMDCDWCQKRAKEWFEQEYQEPIVLSEDEKAVLRNIDKKYKWIARDSDTLSVYEIEPYKNILYWDCEGACREIEIFNHLFQFIKPLDKAYKIDELLGIGGAEGTE